MQELIKKETRIPVGEDYIMLKGIQWMMQIVLPMMACIELINRIYAMNLLPKLSIQKTKILENKIYWRGLIHTVVYAMKQIILLMKTCIDLIK